MNTLLSNLLSREILSADEYDILSAAENRETMAYVSVIQKLMDNLREVEMKNMKLSQDNVHLRISLVAVEQPQIRSKRPPPIKVPSLPQGEVIQSSPRYRELRGISTN
jgi:hypothetical protein